MNFKQIQQDIDRLESENKSHINNLKLLQEKIENVIMTENTASVNGMMKYDMNIISCPKTTLLLYLNNLIQAGQPLASDLPLLTISFARGDMCSGEAPPQFL